MFRQSLQRLANRSAIAHQYRHFPAATTAAPLTVLASQPCLQPFNQQQQQQQLQPWNSRRTFSNVTWDNNVAHSGFDPLPQAPHQHCLTEFTMQNFASYGDKLAVVDGVTGVSRTFADLLHDVDVVAAGLAKLGVKPGNTVALMSPNHVDYFSAFHGVARLGGNTTPLNPAYTKYEVQRQVEASGAMLMIAHRDCLDTVHAALERMGKTEMPVVIFDDVPDASRPNAFETLRTSNEIPKKDDAIFPKIDGESVVALPYSSGTTGLPKGTMLSHNNLIANMLQGMQLEKDHAKPDDVIVSPLPLYHIYAFTCSLHNPLFTGNTLVTMKRFNVDQFCALVEKYQATHAHVVPPIVLGLAKSPDLDKYDMSSLRVAMSAAAPLASEQEKEFSDRVNCIIKQAWGMSELSPIGTYTPDHLVKSGDGSCGFPVSGTSIKVVDLETGEALPPGQEGEFCIKGPQVMSGYLNEPEKTADCLSADGWLRTGDIAKIDQEGRVYITDRLKDLIKYKGFQVAPAELEAVLCTHPEIAEAAVVPISDEAAGEVPRAFVAAKIGCTLNAEQVKAWVAERVAPHKRLRGGVVVLDSIPKTASGKLLRRLLIDTPALASTDEK